MLAVEQPTEQSSGTGRCFSNVSLCTDVVPRSRYLHEPVRTGCGSVLGGGPGYRGGGCSSSSSLAPLAPQLFIYLAVM